MEVDGILIKKKKKLFSQLASGGLSLPGAESILLKFDLWHVSAHQGSSIGTHSLDELTRLTVDNRTHNFTNFFKKKQQNTICEVPCQLMSKVYFYLYSLLFSIIYT